MHQPGVEPVIFRSLVRRPNHYITEPYAIWHVVYFDLRACLGVYYFYRSL